MFTRFKRPQHTLPFQFFFGRDSRYHAQTGTLLTKNAGLVRFSIVGLLPNHPLDETLMNALFQEARAVKLKPVGLQDFFNVTEGVTYSFFDQAESITYTDRTLEKTVGCIPVVAVLARRFDETRAHVIPISVSNFFNKTKDLTTQLSDVPQVNDALVRDVFNFVERSGLIPIALVATGIKAVEALMQPAIDLSQHDLSTLRFGFGHMSNPDEIQHTEQTSIDDSGKTYLRQVLDKAAGVESSKISFDTRPKPSVDVEQVADADKKINYDTPAVIRRRLNQ